MPAVYGLRQHTEVGGLISYGIDLLANWRHAADFVHRILGGMKPAELPVELPTKFELVINENRQNARSHRATRIARRCR